MYPFVGAICWRFDVFTPSLPWFGCVSFWANGSYTSFDPKDKTTLTIGTICVKCSLLQFGWILFPRLLCVFPGALTIAIKIIVNPVLSGSVRLTLRYFLLTLEEMALLIQVKKQVTHDIVVDYNYWRIRAWNIICFQYLCNCKTDVQNAPKFKRICYINSVFKMNK